MAQINLQPINSLNSGPDSQLPVELVEWINATVDIINANFQLIAAAL